MSSKYLNPGDPGSFDDWKKKEIDPYYGKIGYTQECPRCRGHGGWNLLVNAYPLHSYENTSENRHMFSHFRALCEICSGYGYVNPNQNNLNPECVQDGHKWSLVENLGRCYNRYKCLTCGITQDVDSSD